MDIATIFSLVKNHAAYISGVGFAALAVSEYLSGDMTNAMKSLMLALTSFGLKSSIEKVFTGLPDTPAPAASVPPASPAPKA